ncbi:hypothetical protein Mal52_36100 [Symmachiella dynata]|uniref:Uncharacterized protein n=1 Tax=Symmachiella dynata TaxID=2527995 RepID=A0A517ZRK8_9PLAN|nr:hypothetical protein Mal52_36100 [Symmachiella dynata]
MEFRRYSKCNLAMVCVSRTGSCTIDIGNDASGNPTRWPVAGSGISRQTPEKNLPAD